MATRSKVRKEQEEQEYNRHLLEPREGAGNNDILVDSSKRKIKFETEEEDSTRVKDEITEPSTSLNDQELSETVVEFVVKEELGILIDDIGQQMSDLDKSVDKQLEHTIDRNQSNDEKGNCAKPPATRAYILRKRLPHPSQSTNQEDTKHGSRKGRSSLRKQVHCSKELKTAARKCVKRSIGIQKCRNKTTVHQCNVCGKMCLSQSKLDVHMRTHTGEKPFKCNICNANFAHNSHLNRHQRKHTGEKPFQCDICTKKFAYADALNTHRRTHTGEKPYECRICYKKFSNSGHLKRHRRIHTGEKPYDCIFCHEKFSDFTSFTAHHRVHTGERPFKCDICHKEFAHSGNLQYHVGHVHSGK